MQSASSNSVTPAGNPSLESMLHLDALESVFGFLSLRQLSPVMQTCRALRLVIESMAPLQLRASIASANVPIARKSPLIMHVGTLVLGAKINPQSMALLASAAINVQSLHYSRTMCWDCAVSHGEWVLSPKLTDLHLTGDGRCPVSVINNLLSAAASLRSLGELEIVAASAARIDLGPLARLESLHTLSITIESEDEFPEDVLTLTEQQHDALRSLAPNLTSLSFLPGLSVESVRALFAAGHTFQLKDLGRSLLPLQLTTELSELIATLPLESLTVWPTATIDFLPRLAPTLRELCMQLTHCTVQPDVTAGAVSRLTGLTSLSLMGSKMTSDHLASMLRSLPRLRELTLDHLRELQSMAFLAVAGAPKLQSLSLDCCSHPDFSLEELHHLRGQPMLTHLSLLFSFNAPLDDATRSFFTPPSSSFPLLTHFSCYSGEMGVSEEDNEDDDEDPEADEDEDEEH